MIPLKLEIKNFLSYGSEIQTINFEPYNLICLSGKNGHGKSAMLDAITWAIWGQARKILGTSKPDQGLLRLGQRTMVVILDFSFNRNVYRIKREFTFAYGKPYALLEFGLLENETNVLIPLTDKTIKDTQQKIENMIGLDYDSFVNSAFLRQGHSNEFSKKSPKERKEIFANILGLDKYETLRKFAIEKVKIESSQKDGLSKVCEHIEKELETSQTINENLLNLKKEFEKNSTLEKETQLEAKLVEDGKKKLIELNNEYKILDFQLKNSLKDLDEKNKILDSLHKEWKNLHRKYINTINIDDLKQTKENLIKKISIDQTNFENGLKYKENLLKLKEEEQNLLKAIDTQHSSLIQDKILFIERSTTNLNNLNEKVTEYDSNYNKLNIELKNIDHEIYTIEKELNVKKLNEDFEKNELLFERRKTFYQKFIAQGNSVNSELSSLEQKKKLSFDEENPSCPLCEQNLSKPRKKILKEKFEKQEKFLRHRLKRLTSLIKELKEALFKQHDEINNQKKRLEQNNIEKVKIEELKKNKNKVEDQIKNISVEKEKLTKAIDQIKKDIETNNKDVENLNQKNKELILENTDHQKILKAITSITKDLQNIQYDPILHQSYITQLKELEQLCQDNNKNELALFREHKKIEISQICKSIKLINKEISGLQEKTNLYMNLNSIEEDLQKKEFILSQKKESLNKNKEILLGQIGSLENQKQKLEQLSQENLTQKKSISKLTDSIEDYKIISTALSKDGIQALLIEDAIPEVEDEANQLLSKLTDNQAQIFIESLRDLKKGGTKETLDIKISDSHGIRPYEMFSGGEAFRIDFALRIAISKLLARRAGTSLQTLIIDEGFGSQDEEGLIHIMDAIYKIQEDFSKIIIVSHLNSMKDQFPVHFIVEKSPSGSKVKVVEQG